MATTPTVLLRYTQDVRSELRGLARYVGNLEQGRSKVSVNSSLSVGDREDYFRFKVGNDQFVRLRTGEREGSKGTGDEVAKAGSVRYQLFSASGQVLADSGPASGAAFEHWEKLNGETNLSLGKGSYTLRISRGKEGSPA